MNARARLLFCALAFALSGCSHQAEALVTSAAEAATPIKGFTLSQTAVNGATIGYAKGGSGPVILLLHGFPEDMSAWSEVAPRLAAHYTVLAPDLRGIGRSTADSKGFEFPVMAEDMAQLMTSLGIRNAYVVGHDLGGPVAYALAKLHPDLIRGVMLVEAPLEGMPTWKAMEGNPALWHIAFHQTPSLPETLIAEREQAYVRHFLVFAAADKASVKDDSVVRYARAYQSPSKLNAAMEMYRAMPSQGTFNQQMRTADNRPIAVVSGETSFARMGLRMAEDLKSWGWQQPSSVIVPGAGHYIADEQPRALAELIAVRAATAP